MRRPPAILLTSVLLFAMVLAVEAQRRNVFILSRNHPAIAYGSTPTADPVAKLNEQLASGAVRLEFENTTGYLRSVLAALHIPVESQTLVFSQTSLQAPRINVRNPRALYFNDTASVGWVRGGDLLEVAAQDPRQGVVFYTMTQTASDAPRFARRDDCLSCHLIWETLGVPGLIVQSVLPLPDEKSYALGFTTNHTSPFAQRWGGWFVTGAHGRSAHLGNVPVMPVDKGKVTLADPRQITSVKGLFELDGFPTPYSDLSALMVLAHQAHMTNLITRTGWEGRVAEHTPSPEAAARVQDAARDLVDYLLFVDEAPLAAPVTGESGFAARFSSQGPKDRSGRSLRELDLQRRLLKYPCSYMIYSPAFDALPAAAKDAVYRRLWQVLSAQDPDPRYKQLAAADRTAIIEILRDTKKDLPSSFRG